jgi:hypothetical protein
VKTIFHRLSKGDLNSGMHRFYESLNGTTLGELKFTKNLHDIITVVATKP